VKSFLCILALLVATGSAISFAAQPYTLTKYDNSALARACYTDVARYQNHFDGAVTDGVWGVCGYSDRVHRTGPGSVVHNSAIYHHVGGIWKFYHKGNGYLNAAELEAIGVPADAAQQLPMSFRIDVCHRGNVPGTTWYCNKP
jgi:hypothetical protein